MRRQTRSARRPRTVGERLFVGATLTTMAAYLGAPLVVLVGRSLQTADGFGLRHYQSLVEGSTRFVSPLEAIGNSLWFAALATVVAVSVGLAAAVAISRRPARSAARLDTLLMLPLGTSAAAGRRQKSSSGGPEAAWSTSRSAHSR